MRRYEEQDVVIKQTKLTSLTCDCCTKQIQPGDKYYEIKISNNMDTPDDMYAVMSLDICLNDACLETQLDYFKQLEINGKNITIEEHQFN